jgi:hypothetical protein
MFDVMAACLGVVMLRLHRMAVRGMRVVCGLLVVSCLVVLGGFAMMVSGLFVLFGGLVMVIGALMCRHGYGLP